jgi:hypothetical protein
MPGNPGLEEKVDRGAPFYFSLQALFRQIEDKMKANALMEK